LSDGLLNLLVSSRIPAQILQTLKGLIFVAVTTWLLHFLIRRERRSLQEHYALLNSVLESSSDPIFLKDLEGRYCLVNAAVVRLFNRPVSEILGRRDQDLFDAEAANTLEQTDRRVLETACVQIVEECVQINGQHYTFLSTKNVWRDRQGNIAGVLGIVRDISDRVETERALQRRFEFESLISHISTRFVHYANQERNQIIQRAMQEVLAFTGFDRSFLTLFSPAHELATLHCEAYAEGIEPLPEKWRVISTDPFPWWMAKIEALENIEIPTLNGLPTEAINERLALESLSMRSLLVVPVAAQQQAMGYIGFAAVHQEKTWNSDDVALLRIIAELFAGAIQRDQAETALRNSEVRYRKVVEAQADFILRSQPDTTINFANPALCRALGTSLEDIVGKKWADFASPEDLQSDAFQGLSRLSLANPRFFAENRDRRADGKYGWTQWLNEGIFDETGQLVEIQSVGRDITELKQAEARIQELNRTLEAQNQNLEALVNQRTAELVTLINALPDYIMLLDRAEGRILFCNDLMARMANATSRAEIEGQTITECFSPENAAYLTAQNQQVFASGETLRIEEQFNLSTGTLYLETYKIPLKLANGQVYALISTSRDISDRKQAEQKLRQSSERLSLANAELARATRLKDEFLANMSHELRTPLNAILGLSEALQEQVYGSLTDKQRRSINTIQQSGQHLLALINDILDLSKVEAGRMDLHFTQVSVHDLCEASLTFVQQQANAGGLTLTATIAPGLSEIWADGRRMRQALINLLSNAVKFTPPGGRVSLEVTLDSDRECVHFSVVDTGIGIASENLDRLFQPFVQLDSTLSRRYAGTGLGLALVQRIAELHGGSVAVESLLNQGSRFTLSLPWQQTVSAAAPADQPIPLTTICQQIQSVMVIEDSHPAASQLVRYLSELGITAMLHPQAEGAIAQIRQTEPDLLILDLLLPEQSGWQILAELKANPIAENFPVLVVSVPDERSRALQMGAVEHLVKPISRADLQRALGQIALSLQTSTVPAQPLPAPSVDRSPQATILVAEDNEANLSTLVDYLQVHHYAVIAARNGLEAVELTRQHRPDLVLMDIQMPEVDGLEAIRRLRGDADVASIPIVALTALVMPGDEERCLAIGANAYLPKPISLRTLMEIIRHYTERQTCPAETTP